MDSFLYRYRNITVLLIVLFAQLVLLAWQVKSDSDVPMVRVWAISAIAPAASAIENARNGTTGFFSNYFELKNARQQSAKLRTEVDRLRVENQLLKNDLESAKRAESLAGFQSHALSKMIGARVIGTTTGMGSKSVLIDRGTASGVRKGMAVVTPDGIIGRVLAVYPFASQVIAITDPGFAAGVESQKNHAHGVVKGVGNESAKVDYVPAGEKVDVGEMFFTSGEDRIFPRGLPVGKVRSVKEGSSFQEIYLQPTGIENAPEEVLVIVDPVHQAIPDTQPEDTPVFLAPDLKPGVDPSGGAVPTGPTTADKMMEQYKKIGDAQKHQFGEGGPGTPPPNFNLKVPGVNAPANPPGAAGTGAAKPAAATGTVVKPAASPASEGPAGKSAGAVIRPPQANPAPGGRATTPSAGTTPAGTNPAGSITKPPVRPAPGTVSPPGTTTTGPGATTSVPVRIPAPAPKTAPVTPPQP